MRFALAFILMMPIMLYAKQISFNRSKVDNNYQFSYQWLDAQKQNQQLSFAINKKALFGKFRNFRSFKADIAQQHVMHMVRKNIKQQPFEDVQVHFEQQDNQTVVTLSSNNDSALNKAKQQLAKLKQAATKQYLTENFYHSFNTYDQTSGIKPDHVRIANQSIVDLKPLKPILLEKVSVKNIRNASNFTLGFVQSIPYSTLESRRTSSGAGFNPPLKLLYENQGDCDSKVTLTAALLRSLMPRVKMVMVFIDQHALIGVNVSTTGDESIIEHEGVVYVLGEPTGPELMNLGEISDTSDAAIANGHYSVENYHAVMTKK